MVVLDADAIFDDQSNLVGGVETEQLLSALNEYGAALCIIMLGKTKEQADAIIATLKSRQLCEFIQFVVYNPSSGTKNGLLSDCDQLYREDGGPSFPQENKLFAIGDFAQSSYPKGLQVWPITSVDHDVVQLHAGLQNVLKSPHTELLKRQQQILFRQLVLEHPVLAYPQLLGKLKIYL